MVVPLLFIKSATVADSNYISKKNIFGTLVCKYSYSEIEKAEFYFSNNITYDVTFQNGDVISLQGGYMLFDPFLCENNIVQFDKKITNNTYKELVGNMSFVNREYVKSFFDSSDAYSYFDEYFKNYYN